MSFFGGHVNTSSGVTFKMIPPPLLRGRYCFGAPFVRVLGETWQTTRNSSPFLEGGQPCAKQPEQRWIDELQSSSMGSVK